MFRQAIQRAPGAMPIWLSPPSVPTAVPVTCDPCELSSQGTAESAPQGFPGFAVWIESCQLYACETEVPSNPR